MVDPRFRLRASKKTAVVCVVSCGVWWETSEEGVLELACVWWEPSREGAGSEGYVARDSSTSAFVLGTQTYILEYSTRAQKQRS